MKTPLVSVIVTTKNEEEVLESLLKSIRLQTYKETETIIVDNGSTDKTKEIASRYTRQVFNKGPERSAQRNFGAKKARGDFYLFLDADMVLEKDVVKECVEEIKKGPQAVTIPEETSGVGFWAKVKAFERSFYVGDPDIEAARFYSKKLFLVLGGFDELITGPEDWDLSERARKIVKVGRIKSSIVHNEGRIKLLNLLKKKYYYARKTRRYLSKNKKSTISPQTIFFLRRAFYKKPFRIIEHPILTLSMMYMLSFELIAGVLGYYSSDER